MIEVTSQKNGVVNFLCLFGFAKHTFLAVVSTHDGHSVTVDRPT